MIRSATRVVVGLHHPTLGFQSFVGAWEWINKVPTTEAACEVHAASPYWAGCCGARGAANEEACGVTPPHIRRRRRGGENEGASGAMPPRNL